MADLDPFFRDCLSTWHSPLAETPAHKDLFRLASRVVVWVAPADPTPVTPQQLRDSVGASLDSDESDASFAEAAASVSPDVIPLSELDEMVNSMPSLLTDVEPHEVLLTVVTTSMLRQSSDSLRKSAEHSSPSPSPSPAAVVPSAAAPAAVAPVSAAEAATIAPPVMKPIEHVARILDPIARFFETPEKHASIMAYVQQHVASPPHEPIEFSYDLFHKIMGAESKTARLFKVINQAIVMPGALYFRQHVAHGTMMKDYHGPDGWRIIVTLSKRVVNVTHLRREQALEPPTSPDFFWVEVRHRSGVVVVVVAGMPSIQPNHRCAVGGIVDVRC